MPTGGVKRRKAKLRESVERNTERIVDLFLDNLIADGRVRWFNGRLDQWPTHPMDDTAEAAAEMRRRLDF